MNTILLRKKFIIETNEKIKHYLLKQFIQNCSQLPNMRVA
jgi:hypothetical protein